MPFEAGVDQDRGRAFTLHQGEGGVFVIEADARGLGGSGFAPYHAWELIGDEFILYPDVQALFAPVMWSTDVSTVWHGDEVIWPGEVLDGAEKDGRLTGFGWLRQVPTEEGVEDLDGRLFGLHLNCPLKANNGFRAN